MTTTRPLPAPTPAFEPGAPTRPVVPDETQPSRRPLARRRAAAELTAEEAEFVRTTVRGPVRHPVHTTRCCSGCGGPVRYHERWDSMYCTRCDCWLEGPCGEGCSRCARRPVRPSATRDRRA